jgi:thioredoxin reductase
MTHNYEYLIIGGGPAALQLAYYFQRDGRSYRILEAADRPGAFFAQYPRHRRMISNNKVHTGYDDPELRLRHDWNSLLTDDYSALFKDFSVEYFPPAAALLEYLANYVDQFKLQLETNTRVTQVTRLAQGFGLQDQHDNRWTCRRLVIASGLSLPYIPAIPGIEFCENYSSMPVDPNAFVNQRVLIIGKGNSAFETADNLIASAAVIHLVSPNPLDFAWKTHFVGDLRAVNNNILDTYQLKSQNAILDAETLGIRQLEGGKFAVQFRYQHAEGEIEELVYDRVLCCTGFRFDASIFDESTRPELAISNKFPSMTCEWESTNQPDMFFIGTLMQMRDYHKSTSGFIHGFRYNIQAFHHLLGHKFHATPWPSVLIPYESDTLTKKILSRINGSSALWQQHSFLADVFVEQSNKTVQYYDAMPLDYLQNHLIDSDKHCFVISLEFGSAPHDEDPFQANRIRRDNVAKASSSKFLHPAIREYRHGAQISEHHIIEDLEAEWCEAEHIEPLRKYLGLRIGGVTSNRNSSHVR